MATRSPRRAFARPVLLLPFFSLACTPPPPPTTPELPQVSITVDDQSAVGRSLKLSISTSGCDQVQSLELLDDNAPLKQVSFTGSPMQVELGMKEIRYSQGIAANLSLTARVTCADGRTNISQAQPATFFPVEEVVESPDGNSQVVPDYFVIDGSGANATFIGCGKDNNGRSWLYKVSKSKPASPQSVPMPTSIPCDGTTLITDRKPAGTGWRWVWTPGTGAFAIDPNLKITGTTIEQLDSLTIDPDGNALIGHGGVIFKLRTREGKDLWTRKAELPGLVFGEPLVVPSGGSTGGRNILVPLRMDEESSNSTEIMVHVMRYSDGVDVDTYHLGSISPIQTPAVAFNASGKVLYMSVQGKVAANVRACTVSKAGPCERTTPTTLLWESDPLQGYMAALIPYNNGSRLAAITSNRFWFLDTKTSLPVNKDQLPFTANGALVARFAQQGPPPPHTHSSSFYMFNSAVSTDANPAPYPVEILATDAAEKGELYRYQVPGGSIYGALDDSGELWLRVGLKLVKPLPPEQYRALR